MSEPELSLARHALLVLGAAAAVLVLTVVVLGVVQPGAGWALVIAAAGLFGCVGAMAVAARRSTRGVVGSGAGSEPD